MGLFQACHIEYLSVYSGRLGGNWGQFLEQLNGLCNNARHRKRVGGEKEQTKQQGNTKTSSFADSSVGVKFFPETPRGRPERA